MSLSLFYQNERTISNAGILTLYEVQCLSVLHTTRVIVWSTTVFTLWGSQTRPWCPRALLDDHKVKIWTLSCGHRPLILGSAQVTLFTGQEYHYVVHSSVCPSINLSVHRGPMWSHMDLFKLVLLGTPLPSRLIGKRVVCLWLKGLLVGIKLNT